MDRERLEGNQPQQQSQGDAAAAEPRPEGAAASSGGDGDGEGSSGGLAAAQMESFRRRESSGYAAPKARPLHTKIELLLDLIFRRLFWDPAQPEIAFSYDGLLRMLKKIDKDMGP